MQFGPNPWPTRVPVVIQGQFYMQVCNSLHVVKAVWKSSLDFHINHKGLLCLILCPLPRWRVAAIVLLLFFLTPPLWPWADLISTFLCFHSFFFFFYWHRHISECVWKEIFLKDDAGMYWQLEGEFFLPVWRIVDNTTWGPVLWGEMPL